MTPILFLIAYGVGILLTIFRHPIFGLYTYLFTFYMAPSYTWWRDEIPDLRYMFIVGIITIIALFRLPTDTQRLKWHQTGAAKLFLLFVLFNWLQVFWAIDRDVQIEGAIMFTKHLVAFYLIYRLADSIERVIQIAMVHVVGCFWFGWQALGEGYGRLETIGGAVAGANELGVHVTTGIFFAGIMLLGIKDLRRIILFGCIPFIFNCLILTISRGAFLGFVAGGIGGYLLVPKSLRASYRVIGILGIVLFSLLAHDQLIERFTDTYRAMTTDEVEIDRSAASRIEIAKAGIKIGLDYPFGAGHKSTAFLSEQYMDETVLGYKGGRAAHNTFAAVFAEYGFPGFILYFLMIFWVFRTVVLIHRSGGTDETERYQMCMAFTASSLIAIYVSGNFSNNIDLETQYWCLALLASISQLHEAVVGKVSEIASISSGTTASTEINTRKAHS